METLDTRSLTTATGNGGALPEFAAVLTDNPLEADEFVYVTYDVKRAEEILHQQASTYRADKTIYVIAPNPELNTLFDDPERFGSVRGDLSKLKGWSLHNFQARRIDKVVFISKTRL